MIKLLLLLSLLQPVYAKKPKHRHKHKHKSKIDKKIRKYIKSKYRYKTTSGYRTHKHNKRVGGARNSYHLYNRARDIVPTNKYMRKKIITAIAAHSPLSLIIYDTHLHIDDRDIKVCMVKTPKWYRYCVFGKDVVYEDNIGVGIGLEIDF